MDIPSRKHLLLMILSMNLAVLAVCSCSTLSDTTIDVSTGECCAKDTVDKLMVQLKEKDKELEEKKQANEELLANLEKARVAEAGMDELKLKLAYAHKTISAYQMTFWKSFPSPRLYYQIMKVPLPLRKAGFRLGHLYADAGYSGYLYSSPTTPTSNDLKGHFKFEKDLDGAYSIFSMSEGKYLQIQTSSCTSAASVISRANVDNKSKFVIIVDHQQGEHLPGILVDIYSLSNGCFLSADEVDEQNQLVANSPTAPSSKFLILAEDVEKMWEGVKMNK